jgi:hypothetical protein
VTGRTTRADRMAQPTSRDAVRAVAENHGACLRPVQLRRTDPDTGQVEQVLIPCGATLASICPSCAERARNLRASQCREGWHLETEPIPDPPAPDDVQAMWIEKRAQAQANRDHAPQSGQDTAELDELLGELDAELARSGLRGKADPGRPNCRHRSTKRRQDAPDLPRRKISSRTVGKTYTAPDGKTFRPSMFVTLTCPSFGRVRRMALRPTPAPTTMCGLRGMRWRLRRCSTGSSRTCAATSATTCSTSLPSNRNAASPRTCTSPYAALSPAPNYGRSSLRPTIRCGGPPPARCASTATICRSGTSRPAATSTRPPANGCPPGMTPWTPSPMMTNLGTWPVRGPSSTPRACSPDPATPLLKKLGVPARDAMVILGHSRISVTLEIYTHVDEESRRDAVGRIDRLLSGPALRPDRA